MRTRILHLTLAAASIFGGTLGTAVATATPAVADSPTSRPSATLTAEPEVTRWYPPPIPPWTPAGWGEEDHLECKIGAKLFHDNWYTQAMSYWGCMLKKWANDQFPFPGN